MTKARPHTFADSTWTKEGDARSSRTVWINEDNAHFYDCHPLDDMSVAGLEALVDTYLEGTNVAGVLFCANVQRALFDSQAWEPLYHGYDPQCGGDQPGFMNLPAAARDLSPDQRGRYWVHALWLLKERGIDHLQVWLDRCRHHLAEGWLSMRMNDCHHNADLDAFWHPTLWRERPDLHRAHWRNEGWFEGAFDYGKTEVVEHHLALLRELCERYDMDGIELDWVRWVRHFRPGHEAAGAEILTAFMCEAQHYVHQAAKRLGHPVKLSVRLPAEITACLQLGYDVLTWAAEGLVDQIVLATFLEQTYFDWPVDQWKALFGPEVLILCQPDAVMRTYPAAGSAGRVLDYRLLLGAASCAHTRGADGIYLFNECYRENEHNAALASQFPGILQTLCHELGDAARLREMPRRQAVSYAQIVGPGVAAGNVFPIPLTRPEGSFEFGRFGAFITLRLLLGGKPKDASVYLELGFDLAANELHAADFQISVNSHAVDATSACASVDALPKPKVARGHLCWRIPIACLHDDANIVEITPPKRDGHLVWAEFNLVSCTVDVRQPPPLPT